jgi:hypothetical protein
MQSMHSNPENWDALDPRSMLQSIDPDNNQYDKKLYDMIIDERDFKRRMPDYEIQPYENLAAEGLTL